MNFETYKKRLFELASHKNAGNSNPSIPYGSFENTVYDFLDNTYEIYLNASAVERQEIRNMVKKYHIDSKDIREGEPIPLPFSYILNWYSIRVIKNLKATGSEIWLTRGLVAISMLDCIHYRPDDEEHLARLYVTAEKTGIDPKPVYQKISAISNNESTKSGEISTSELIANIPNVAHDVVNQLKQWGVLED
jgi:hypothetical protein